MNRIINVLFTMIIIRSEMNKITQQSLRYSNPGGGGGLAYETDGDARRLA